MEQYISKDALVMEIEKIQNEFSDSPDRNGNFDELENQGANKALDSLEFFLNTLDVKKVDLEKEFSKWWESERVKDYNVDILYERYSNVSMKLAKHFFELGLKANQENNAIGTFEREVKIDAGGYHYIDCDIEFYDYDKDISLAKEGDKVKVIVVKEEKL